jgi:hypothetical protein
VCPLLRDFGDKDLWRDDDLQRCLPLPWGLWRDDELLRDLPSPRRIFTRSGSVAAPIGPGHRHVANSLLRDVRRYITDNDKKWRFIKVYLGGWCSSSRISVASDPHPQQCARPKTMYEGGQGEGTLRFGGSRRTPWWSSTKIWPYGGGGVTMTSASVAPPQTLCCCYRC